MKNTETTLVNNKAILLPSMDTSIPPSGRASMPLNGERLDNVAYVFYGDHLQYPRVMKRNNIGFLFDTPPDKKVIIE